MCGEGEGAVNSDLPTDRLNTIRPEAEYSNFMTTLLCKTLKCACIEFSNLKFLLLGKYIQEVDL